MGHGILSDTPFHVIGGWTTDMSVNYSEINRWEREKEKKKNPWPDPLDPTIQAQKREKLNIPQQVYRLSEKAVPPFRGKCTAYPPRCTAHSLGYDVKII